MQCYLRWPPCPCGVKILKNLHLQRRIFEAESWYITSEILCLWWSSVGWVWWRCRVSEVIGASNWYWLPAGQGLLSLLQVRVEKECFYFFCFFTFIPVVRSSLSLSFISSTILSHFSRSLGDNTKWPTRVDVSLKPNDLWPFKANKICVPYICMGKMQKTHFLKMNRPACRLCRRASLWPGGCGFDPRPGETKDH